MKWKCKSKMLLNMAFSKEIIEHSGGGKMHTVALVVIEKEIFYSIPVIRDGAGGGGIVGIILQRIKDKGGYLIDICEIGLSAELCQPRQFLIRYIRILTKTFLVIIVQEGAVGSKSLLGGLVHICILEGGLVFVIIIK